MSDEDKEEGTNVYKMPETLLEWFQKQLSSSGISPQMADHAGLVLHTHDPLGIKIPYYDKFGDSVPGYFRLRVRDTDVPFAATYEERMRTKSKYLQEKGLGQLLYWPRFMGVDHAENLGDIHRPIYFVEGEKKALRLQAELSKLGIQGTVLGLPGIKLGKTIYKEISSLPFLVSKQGRRVVVAFDWNNPDAEAEAETRAAENRLIGYVRDLGAECQILRWAVSENELAEQKVDDWLVAGGDLMGAEEYSKDLEAGQSDLSAKLHEFNELYAVYSGKIILQDASHVELSGSQFHLQTADKYLWDETGNKPKRMQVSDIWLSWGQRTVVTGRTFFPPPIGQQPEKIVNGKINVSPKWPEHNDSPFEEYNHEPFDWLLRRFCENEEQFHWLRKHIAHTARRPTEGSSNAVVFADDGGTGKGLLFRTLRKLFGHFVVEIKDELTGRFNDRLAGRLIGLYDEPDYDRSENINIDKSTKRIVGNPYLSVEGKGLRPYTVENYLRLMVSMNLKFIGRISHHDRRWNYFTAAGKMTSTESADYTAWLKHPTCGAALTRWVYSIDISDFDSNVLGPVSKGRIEAIEHSSSVFAQFLEWEGLLERDVWSMAELNIMFTSFAPGYRRINPVALGIQFKTLLGEDSARVVKIGGKAQRLRAVRNVGSWIAKDASEWVKEHHRGR